MQTVQVHVIACASVLDQQQVHVRIVVLVSPDVSFVCTTGDNQRVVCGRHLMCVEDTSIDTCVEDTTYVWKT